MSKPFVGPAAAARRPELADRAPRPVRPENRKDVIPKGDSARPNRKGTGRGGVRQQPGERDQREEPEPARTQGATLKYRFAGEGSGCPEAETALTLKVCLPGARPL